MLQGSKYTVISQKFSAGHLASNVLKAVTGYQPQFSVSPVANTGSMQQFWDHTLRNHRGCRSNAELPNYKTVGLHSKQNIEHQQHRSPKKKCNACFYKPTITKKTTIKKCRVSQTSFQMYYKRKKNVYIYKIKKSEILVHSQLPNTKFLFFPSKLYCPSDTSSMSTG